MRTLSRQDLADILYGAAILGAGGGGELDEGFAMIDEALAAGKTFKLVSLDEVPDEALICTPYLLGAISGLSEEEERQYQRLPRSERHPILAAYDHFQRHLGQEFYATTACEMGGSNTAVAFYAAAMNGHCVLDADPAGRAVPEITHSTYYLNGLPASPIVAANEFGESFVLDQVIDDQRAEVLVRAVCQVSRNDISAIDHALPMSQLRDALIPGTMSLAMALGRVWREAIAAGEDVAAQVAQAGKGFVGFRGIVSQGSHETRDGFTYGEIIIAGSGDLAGQTYRITLKNENMAGWLNDELHATIPDLICLIDTQTGEPVTNPNYYESQAVAVVFLPAPEPFTTPKGLEVFGPSYLGLNSDYKPVCS